MERAFCIPNGTTGRAECAFCIPDGVAGHSRLSLPRYLIPYLSVSKSFRCNTYKKPGGGGPGSSSYFASVSANSAPSVASVLNPVLLFTDHCPLINCANTVLPAFITSHQSPITSHQSPVTNHESPVTLLSEPLPVRRECIERTIGTGGPSRQTILRPEFRCFRLHRRVRWVSFLGVGSSSNRASRFFVPTNN